MADALGDLKIGSVDAALEFEVLVVAKGFEAARFNRVDPQLGPLKAWLDPRAATNPPPNQVLLGCVIGPDRKPVRNAIVSVEQTALEGSYTVFRGFPVPCPRVCPEENNGPPTETPPRPVL